MNPWYILVVGLFTGAAVGILTTAVCAAAKCGHCKYNDIAVRNVLSYREIPALEPTKLPRCEAVTLHKQDGPGLG